MEIQIDRQIYEMEVYSITAVDQVAQGLPMNPMTVGGTNIPTGVVVLDANLATGESIAAFSYTLTNNVPQVTVTFSSAITRQVRIGVLYKH
jgi:hypothetical protein